MTDALTAEELTGALEDYLETIYEFVRERGFARVKDIAQRRGVRAASVSPAMARLAKLGLVAYQQREYISLTPAGEQQARRVYARHQVLARVFEELLRMPADTAQRDACAMEHSLSPAAMDHLVRFFEYLQICPDGRRLLAGFHGCSAVHEGLARCPRSCPAGEAKSAAPRTIAALRPGQRGRVTQVGGSGALRQRLLDMGLLPGVLVELERVAPAGDPLWIKLQGFQLSLRRKEARAVSVVAAEA